MAAAIVTRLCKAQSSTSPIPTTAYYYLAAKRWPNGVACPACPTRGTKDVIFLANQHRLEMPAGCVFFLYNPSPASTIRGTVYCQTDV